jgi:hypothetical protein
MSKNMFIEENRIEMKGKTRFDSFECENYVKIPSEIVGIISGLSTKNIQIQFIFSESFTKIKTYIENYKENITMKVPNKNGTFEPERLSINFMGYKKYTRSSGLHLLGIEFIRVKNNSNGFDIFCKLKIGFISDFSPIFKVYSY